MNLLNFLDIEHNIFDLLAEKTPPDENFFRQYSFDISKQDLMFILLSLDSDEKYYWCNRDKSFESISGKNLYYLIHNDNSNISYDISKIIEPNVRYYYSTKFDKDSPISDEWAEFGKSSYILPLWSVEAHQSKYSFVLNLNRKLYREILDNPEFLRNATKMSIKSPEFKKLHLIKENNHQEFNVWREKILASLEDIRSGQYSKIVLARKKQYEIPYEQNISTLFAKLCSSNLQTYNFFWQISPKSTFLGNSPERLLRISKNILETEALAGTLQNGDKIDEKLKNENDFVKQYLIESLNKISNNVIADKVQTVNLKHLNHLQVKIRAELREDELHSPVAIANYLMPTPAVNGYPKSPTFEYISKYEGFDRGHYAGALGTVCNDTAEFCVPLRSALINEKMILIFAGAGILEGSDPQEEWKEIDKKFMNFTEHFSIEK